MSGKADWDAASAMVPYADGDWQGFLTENPEALYRIIADTYDVVLRERERANGVRRSGRRPKPSQVPIEEVYAAVFPPRYAMEPFIPALEALVGNESQRSFSRRVPCDQATLSRLLSGRLAPDLSMMERLAGAAGVKPWYFAEWRAAWVGGLIRDVLASRPDLSIKALQGLRAYAERGR